MINALPLSPSHQHVYEYLAYASDKFFIGSGLIEFEDFGQNNKGRFSVVSMPRTANSILIINANGKSTSNSKSWFYWCHLLNPYMLSGEGNMKNVTDIDKK